ncbi:LysM peptidoglycan-binding domain-containing protein [Candidatus Nomurabacteria bacterium]|nr:LysM peptidoglycan-binding domain-containing protein [Candidatus Nomurabacteria bacterium]
MLIRRNKSQNPKSTASYQNQSKSRQFRLFLPMLYLMLIVFSLNFQLLPSIISTTEHSQAQSFSKSVDNYGFLEVTSDLSRLAPVAELSTQVNNEEQSLDQNDSTSLDTTGGDFITKPKPVLTEGKATRDVVDYQVKEGDTVSTIASQFGLTTDTVRWANQLELDQVLEVGETLKILPIDGVLHWVEPGSGDTLDQISALYKVDKKVIVSYNQILDNKLEDDMVLVVPGGQIEEVEASQETTQNQVALDQPATTQTYNQPVQANSTAPEALTSYSGGYNNYAYGYCTWYVANRRAVPASMGNAANWYYAAQAAGFGVGSQPVVGAVAWTPAGYYGHVAYVEAVEGSQVYISEMNYAGWGVVSYRWVPANAFSYIY